MLDTTVVTIDTQAHADLVYDLRFCGQNSFADRLVNLDVDATADVATDVALDA